MSHNKAVLTDEKIYDILSDCGFDWWDVPQGSTAVFAKAIEAAVLASADNPSTAGAAKGGITNEEIDAIARPYSGMGGVEDYRAFARALLAAPALNPSEVPTDLVRTGWFIHEAGAWIATSSDDPRATILYRKNDTLKGA